MIEKWSKLYYIDFSNTVELSDGSKGVITDGVNIPLDAIRLSGNISLQPITPPQAGWFLVHGYINKSNEKYATSVVQASSIDNSLDEVKTILEISDMGMIPYKTQYVTSPHGHTFTAYLATTFTDRDDRRTPVDHVVKLSNGGYAFCCIEPHLCRQVKEIDPNFIASVVKPMLISGKGMSELRNSINAKHYNLAPSAPINISEAPIQKRYFNMYHHQDDVRNTNTYILEYLPNAAFDYIVKISYTETLHSITGHQWVKELYIQLLNE